ncbi:hypothetical protein ACJJTC_011417 [Scirpophaga incertulas]
MSGTRAIVDFPNQLNNAEDSKLKSVPTFQPNYLNEHLIHANNVAFETYARQCHKSTPFTKLYEEMFLQNFKLDAQLQLLNKQRMIVETERQLLEEKKALDVEIKKKTSASKERNLEEDETRRKSSKSKTSMARRHTHNRTLPQDTNYLRSRSNIRKDTRYFNDKRSSDYRCFSTPTYKNDCSRTRDTSIFRGKSQVGCTSESKCFIPAVKSSKSSTCKNAIVSQPTIDSEKSISIPWKSQDRIGKTSLHEVFKSSSSCKTVSIRYKNDTKSLSMSRKSQDMIKTSVRNSSESLSSIGASEHAKSVCKFEGELAPSKWDETSTTRTQIARHNSVEVTLKIEIIKKYVNSSILEDNFKMALREILIDLDNLLQNNNLGLSEKNLAIVSGKFEECIFNRFRSLKLHSGNVG